MVTVIPPATPSEGTQQKPEEQKPEDNVSAATTSDLVGMGYCSTAKAYSVTLNQLKALDDFEGYKVTYDIAPKASARIVDGPRGVEEGGTLVFGVKNQIGYAIEAVAVNGEALEADSVTDNDDGSQTAWYTVPEVYEEQEVVVSTFHMNMLTMPMMLSMFPSETVDVTLKKTDDDGFNETYEIAVGDIAQNAPAVERYEFAYAKVDNTIVKIVAVDGDSGTIYVTTDDNQLTGIALEDSREIVLYYKPVTTRYDISYIIKVDGQQVDTSNAPAEIIGVSYVEAGENLEFSFTLKEGYTTTNVVYKIGNNSKEISPDGNKKYTIIGIQDNVVVTN